MKDYRIEKDTMGEVKVPANALYGAQTQRSIENFKIAQDINRMPIEIIRAFAILKKAAALTNLDAGILSKDKASLIGKVCDEILKGKLDDSFPLVVCQTTRGNESSSLPFNISSHTFPIRLALSFDNMPASRLVRAAAFFRIANARMISIGILLISWAILKFSMLRWVCAPYRALAGTFTSPIVSFSIL